MFATGGTPPLMAQAQSFTIHTRLTNTSGFRHKLRHKLTQPLHLDQGMPSGLVYVSARFGTPPLTINLALDTLFPFTWVQTVAVDTASTFHIHFPTSTPENPPHSNFSLQITPPSAHHPLLIHRVLVPCVFTTLVIAVAYLESTSSSCCRPSPPLQLTELHSASQSGQPTLNFGSDAIIDASATNVQTTPLISSTLSSAPEKFYNYLNMTAVTVNGDVYMMPENSSANLVLLDSGSPDSWLIEDAIFSLQDSIVKYFAKSYGWKHPKIESESARGYPCCYDLPSNLASVVFPKVAMQFLGGASLELHNAFEIFAAEHEFCMVIREGAPNVIGVLPAAG
ncbi:hypothetical protein ACLB2K_064588 [Fragaria x ananassa]